MTWPTSGVASVVVVVVIVIAIPVATTTTTTTTTTINQSISALFQATRPIKQEDTHTQINTQT